MRHTSAAITAPITAIATVDATLMPHMATLKDVSVRPRNPSRLAMIAPSFSADLALEIAKLFGYFTPESIEVVIQSSNL